MRYFVASDFCLQVASAYPRKSEHSNSCAACSSLSLWRGQISEQVRVGHVKAQILEPGEVPCGALPTGCSHRLHPILVCYYRMVCMGNGIMSILIHQAPHQRYGTHWNSPIHPELYALCSVSGDQLRLVRHLPFCASLHAQLPTTKLLYRRCAPRSVNNCQRNRIHCCAEVWRMGKHAGLGFVVDQCSHSCCNLHWGAMCHVPHTSLDS